MRLFASLDHYVATRDASGLQIHQYGSARVVAPVARGTVALRMASEYPWAGRVRLTIEETGAAPWTLARRVPGWCAGATVRINGREAATPLAATGYLRLERAWAGGDVVELDTPIAPRLVEAHPWIESARGSVAIERGPLVYCLEQVDHPKARIADLEIDATAPLTAAWEPDRLEGVTVVGAAGWEIDRASWGDRLYRPLGSAPPASRRPVALTAIPYYAWANREPGAMRVWIPRAEDRS
jgi:DUF1680 family protein